MTTTEVYLKDLAATLYKFQLENILCDTVLIADDCQIWAHSIVLAAVSPYVCSHFLMITGHKAKYRFSLKLAGCDAVCVKAVLHFLYTGSLILPTSFQHPEAFAGILRVCEKLGINVARLNGAAVKFVEVNPYLNSVETNDSDHDCDQNDSSNQEASSDLCLEDDKQPDAVTSSRKSKPDTWHESVSYLEAEEQVVEEEKGKKENAQLENDGCTDIKLEMGVYEPSSPNYEYSDFFETEDDKMAVPSEVLEMESASFIVPSHRISEALKNSYDGAVNLEDGKILAVQRNGSLRISSKSLENAVKKQKTKSMTARRAFKSSDFAESDSLSQLYCVSTLERSGKSIREKHKKRYKENGACHICGKRFKWQSDLKKHIKEYQTHSVLTCRECGKVLTSKRQLQVHEKLHAGQRLHVCPTCGKAYRYRSGLVIHSYEHSGQLPYLCDICGAGFKDFFSMGQHKKRRHSTFRPFICQQCGKGFIRNVLLLRHMKSHSGEKQHICPKCGMTFGYSANLTRHLRSHVGDKPHSCTVCGKAFNRIDHLQGHALIHKGERNHTCSECQKVFRSAILLRRHATIHSEENLHTCNVCGKRFTAPIRLKQHMVMHQEKQHKCPVCDRTFSFERFLLGHMKKCHQETAAS